MCSRVIVYLGDDIVTASTPFPSSWPLHEIESQKDEPVFPEIHRLHNLSFGLRELLQRRYFSRVWMIQELLFSERAVIRVGNIDFRADSSIM